TSPQQLGGYTYAADNPITGSDPTGLMGCESPDECGGGAQLGNNWPTLHSGGKALNDASWGCNGCDVVNSSNSDPNNQGEVDASRRRAVSAAFHKKFMEIYPGVFIKRNWKYANQFADVFNQEVDNWCQEEGSSCLIDPSGTPEDAFDQHIIAHLKFLTCMVLGHKSGCLGMGKATSIGTAAAALAAVTGGGGEGPGHGSYSSEDLTRVANHLGRPELDHSPINDAMIDGIRRAMTDGRPLSEGERNFMRHELTEAALMDGGMSPEEAHELALQTHTLMKNYTPEVIDKFPDLFNNNWRRAWGMEPR
ncbi:hypothetical protein, partial [Streptomyces sp. NPDC002573]|uniref:hypothetical protein n=1 Tax=Streptomyces sp. NPDC002573 TaxID=3364651 RepID=UPI0036B25EB2